MTLATRFTPIDVNGLIARLLSPAAKSRAVAGIVRREIGEAERHNQRVLGRPTPATVAVDGRRAALESVRVPGGRIVADFAIDVRAEVVRWILAELRRGSPVVSGRYRDSHSVYVNGVAMRGRAPDAIPAGAEVAITNPLEYHRKIEIGKTRSGRPFVLRTEPKLYFRIAQKARAHFGGAVTVTYVFRPASGGRGATASDPRPTIVVAAAR